MASRQSGSFGLSFLQAIQESLYSPVDELGVVDVCIMICSGRPRKLESKMHPVATGTGTLKEAVSEAR